MRAQQGRCPLLVAHRLATRLYIVYDVCTLQCTPHRVRRAQQSRCSSASVVRTVYYGLARPRNGQTRVGPVLAPSNRRAPPRSLWPPSRQTASDYVILRRTCICIDILADAHMLCGAGTGPGSSASGRCLTRGPSFLCIPLAWRFH